MHRTLLMAALTLLAFPVAVPASLQSAQTGAQSTPQALKATYDQAMQARDWPAALAAAQQLVGGNATSANLLLLGNAQLYATTGTNDTGAMEAALATYDRALAAAQQEKPAPGQPDQAQPNQALPNQAQPDQAWKDGMAMIYTAKGNALLKLKRDTEAIDNYNHAAELSSTPGKAYFNVCATAYNTGDGNSAVTACRKSVQADPTLADAWFVLGSSLFAGASADASGKFVISTECRQALEKYLELAPNGSHAADTKQMLDFAAK
jgi:tetratricopeptide (TPR) repeat protein